MAAAVPPPDLPRPSGAVAGQRGSGHPEQARQAAGDVVCHIVQLGGHTAKVEVFFVFVAQHTVHRVDGLVSEGQRGPADQHIEQRRNDTVAGVFGHRLHGGFRHALGSELRSVPAHDPADRFAGPGQIGFFELFINIGALLHQAPGGQRLPAPEHLDGQPQQRVEPGGPPADEPCEQKGAHRQAERHDGTAQQLSLRRFGQTGAQEFFKPGDGLAHVHHRVGQPGRVAKEGVQHKAAQHGPNRHHGFSSAALFVYCTVLITVRICFCVQSLASST